MSAPVPNEITMDREGTSEKEITAKLYGFAKGQPPAGERAITDMAWTQSKNPCIWCCGLCCYLQGQTTQEVKIRDGRALMANSGLSKPEFFKRYGFIVLEHETAMEPALWHDKKALVDTYGAEVPELAHTQLGLPKTLVIPPPMIMTRGPPLPGSPEPSIQSFGKAVHQDYGIGRADYEENMRAYGETPEAMQEWAGLLDEEGCDGYTRVCFWRPIKPMERPLVSSPMCFCDPQTIKPEAIVLHGLAGFTKTGKPSADLRLIFSPEQQWYYFPDMTTSEVIAFKQFDLDKSDPMAPYCSAFHTAFDLPNVPKDAEPRYSSEYRVHFYHQKAGSDGAAMAKASEVKLLASKWAEGWMARRHGKNTRRELQGKLAAGNV